jgi:endonuclease YncB( thermonuclease family)
MDARAATTEARCDLARALLCIVQTKDGDLAEQLVRNGLARIYAFKAAPPGSKNSRMELERLLQLENQARQEKLGAWGINARRLNVGPENQSARVLVRLDHGAGVVVNSYLPN